MNKKLVNAMPFNTKKEIKLALSLMTEKGKIDLFYSLIKERNKTRDITTEVCVDIDKWIEYKSKRRAHE